MKEEDDEKTKKKGISMETAYTIAIDRNIRKFGWYFSKQKPKK